MVVIEHYIIIRGMKMLNKNELKNRVIVESAEGDRTFLLFQGDIFSESADVYIFNSYVGNNGSLIKRLSEIFGQEEIPETPFYFSKDGKKVGKIKLDDGRIILVLHSDLEEHEPITVEQYESFIEIVFTSLTALESFEGKFETVAFPVLLRNSLKVIYAEAVKVLIEKATLWLKQSEHTTTIKYVLYESGDAKVWNDNLNRVLGRKVLNTPEFSNVLIYKNKVLSFLQLIDQRLPFWRDTIQPLQNTLKGRSFSPEVVAAFSRKLLEVFCQERIRLNRVHEKEQDLDGYLHYLRKNQLLNPWDIQVLFQIRSFGNPSIHRPDPLLGPKVMSEHDVTILFICLCRLIELLHDLINNNKPVISSPISI